MTPQEALTFLKEVGPKLECLLGRQYDEYKEALQVLAPQVQEEVPAHIVSPLQNVLPGDPFDLSQWKDWMNTVSKVLNELTLERAQMRRFLNDGIGDGR